MNCFWINSSVSMNFEFIRMFSKNYYSQIITKLAVSLITESQIQCMLDGIICCEMPLHIPGLYQRRLVMRSKPFVRHGPSPATGCGEEARLGCKRGVCGSGVT